MLLLFYARLHWAPGPGRSDVVFQYTVKPVTGFATIDAWLSGKPGALRSALAHLVAAGDGAGTLRPCQHLPADAFRRSFRTWPGICHDCPRKRRRSAPDRFRSYPAEPCRCAADRGRPCLCSLLQGAVLTETVFAWPGIGRYLTTAMFAGDMPAILGATLWWALHSSCSTR